MYFLCRNGQRPGAITGMTMEEFEHGVRATDGSHLKVMVGDQKSKKPAKVIVADQLLDQFLSWVHVLRPLYVSEGCAYVFATEDGQKLSHLSRALTTLAEEFNTSLPTATSVRKAIATRGGALEAAEKTALAHAMSHTVSTADRYYRAYGEATSKKGFEVLGSLLEVESALTKKRQRFTQEQTTLVSDHFSQQIANKHMPSPADLDTFLTMHREKFSNRQRADIYSKVRTIIGRSKK